MSKNPLRVIYLLLFAIFFLYSVTPNPDFPEPPPDSLQSDEPADTETPLRRSYFTNLSRHEILNHYQDQFGYSYRLNYPPEEAQTIIRDQARSSYLEEIVHPFRESVFVNGFVPATKKDAINIEGRSWEQKITVRQVNSSLLVRMLTMAGTFAFIWILFGAWELSVNELVKSIKQIKR